MDPATLDSLDKETLIRLILSQAEIIERLTRRVAELEAKLDLPKKTPDNSSTPPSKGQKSSSSAAGEDDGVGGKKRGMLSQVSYQARTPDFWQACDGIAGPAYFQQFGTSGDAKGEPTQINSMSHGCSPSRFRQIQVIVTD